MLTEEQQQAAANLLIVHPGAVGFDAGNQEAIRIYDQLVEKGHAIAITEADVPEFADGRRAYRLSSEALEAHRRAVEARGDQAELN